MEPVIEELLEESDEVEVVSNEVALQPANNEHIEAVVFIFASVNAAQNVKAGFSMADCTKIVNSRDVLVKHFASTNTPTAESTDAVTIFDNACQFQQKQGAFTIEGSCKLAKALETIKSAAVSTKPAAKPPKAQNNQPPKAQNRAQQRAARGGKGKPVSTQSPGNL